MKHYLAIWHERSKAIILIQLYIYNGTCHYQCTVGENIIGTLKCEIIIVLSNHSFFSIMLSQYKSFLDCSLYNYRLYLFCLFLVLIPYFFSILLFYNFRDLRGVSDLLPLGARKSDNYMGSNKEKKSWTNEQPKYKK